MVVHPAKRLLALRAGGVMRAGWRILGGRMDDEVGGTKIVHPPAGKSLPLTAAEQIAITTLHAAERLFDETYDLGALRRSEPVLARLGVHPCVDQHRGKLTIAGVLLPAIERSQHQDQPSTLLCRERGDRRRHVSCQLLPQSHYRLNTEREIVVEENHRSDRRSRRCIGQNPDLPIDGVVSKKQMTPF
jgi:hypothetical protein